MQHCSLRESFVWEVSPVVWSTFHASFIWAMGGLSKLINGVIEAVTGAMYVDV